MTLSKKFKLALVFSDMDFSKFGEAHGVSRQYISQIVAGKMRNQRIEKAIITFTESKMTVLKDLLNSELAA